MASAVLCSLIKHAKSSQSQSLLELFKVEVNSTEGGSLLPARASKTLETQQHNID